MTNDKQVELGRAIGLRDAQRILRLTIKEGPRERDAYAKGFRRALLLAGDDIGAELKRMGEASA